MNWISEIILKRSANYSTVAIIETLDFKRIEQLIEALRKPEIKQRFKTEKIYIYDLQRNILEDAENRYTITRRMDTPIEELDNMLSTTSIMVIIKYVLTKTHAEMLSDYLLSWCQNSDIYDKNSSVFVFTSGENLFNENLRKFVITYSVTPSLPNERKQLLIQMAHNLMRTAEIQKNLKIKIPVTEQLIQVTAGLNLHEIETASLMSFLKHLKFEPSEYTKYKIELLRKYGIDYIEPKRGFESVGGYNYLKEYVKKRIIKLIKKPSLARKYGLTPPKGIILYGYYGCGKTWFTKALAKEIGLPMIKIDPSTFLRGIVGETEARVKQVIKIVESMSPAIVFIDEIDQLAISREKMFIGDSGVTRRMQNMILDWLGNEDRKSILIGATNFIEQMDKAFIRTGRIDEIILVLPPDKEARKEILKIHATKLRKIPLAQNVDFDELAEITYMFTGGELAKLVQDASFLALEEESKVKQEHFVKAKENIKVNVSEREETILKMIDNTQKLEVINRTFLEESLKTFKKAEGKRTNISLDNIKI